MIRQGGFRRQEKHRGKRERESQRKRNGDAEVKGQDVPVAPSSAAASVEGGRGSGKRSVGIPSSSAGGSGGNFLCLFLQCEWRSEDLGEERGGHERENEERR